MEDYDSRLVDLYDLDNPDGPDHDFYRAMAEEIRAESILDLGCGTGILMTTLAREGRTVIGIDPSAKMLACAQKWVGAEAVTWLHGDSRVIPMGPFDYAVMTGNVAQHIAEIDWMRTLSGLRRALKTGGTLAFESRNPTTRAWEDWASDERTVRTTDHGQLTEWAEIEETSRGTITLRAHSIFADSDEIVTEETVLAFRHRDQIVELLIAAGFEAHSVYGDWKRTPFTENAPCDGHPRPSLLRDPLAKEWRNCSISPSAR